ncbi:PAS domain-containing sensor histidine kinase [Clostridium aciditolerans]|uniref:Circadian input-output histidine kinase CikA n=1 Tax=Clostridium aciditolerans TaxID=339861 RepID=A0A934HRR6_9CLOT|nr:PAS domain S-box protein [Clostridium aciditolerans]MBI6872103.1 PAS domain S-box protein [Clostridium aciditolerans]
MSKGIRDEVKESEKFYKSIFELSGVGIAEVSPDGVFLMINKPFCKITGYSEEELKEKSFKDITYSEDINVDLNYVNDLITDKINGYNTEKRYIRKDGSIVWVNITVSLVRNNDKSPKYFVSVINDITNNKKNEIELKKQAQAVFYCPVSIVVTDKNGIIEYVNPAFEIISGYKKEEALGKNPKIQSSGEGTREFYKNLWGTILKGEIWKGTFKNKKKNGEIYWEESSISPIINSQGKITHFVAVKEDITKRKLIEEELIKSKIEAESANRAKSTFLANMSHEIRTPLNAILGFSELLLNDSNLSEGQKSKVETINRTGEHLLKMINEILEISKIEAGKASINLSEFNIYRLIEDLKNIFYLKAKDKNINLNFFIDDDVPEIIITDELKLRQILINLIGNAIKFTDKGSVSVVINSKNEQNNSLLYVAVKDTGIGIAEENLNKIFDDFTQVYDTKYSKGGTGLGLTITKEFVELLKGIITLKSTYGKGSEFNFFIPVTVANNSKEKSYIKLGQNKNNDIHSNEKEACSLDKETKLKLKEAILDGDVDEINELISNINEINIKEIENLKKLAGEFKYEKILELL